MHRAQSERRKENAMFERGEFGECAAAGLT